MKRIITILVAFVCMVPCASWSAVNVKSSGVKKAAPVATKQTDKMESVTSLLPTVIGLVGSVKALNAQQQQLTAECAPTSSEIQLVNDLVKEWAKTGAVTAASAASGIADRTCSTDPTNNSNHYASFMKYADEKETCYETFTSSSDDGKIWHKFPKASSAHICDDVDTKNCKDVSNIYEVFSRIPFTEEDYTESEASRIAKLIEKSNKCAPGKVNAAKRELYGNFVTQTLGSVGQTTGAAGTSSVLEAVSSMGGSGNIQSILPSLGTMATQMLDK